uniref:Uncharacterized protein n=1 Tax=Arundo donax TaxID=35708 RepID=A0A0A9HP17_ARUDO
MLCCCYSLFLSPFLCWFLWVSCLTYPNLLGTKDFVVVAAAGRHQRRFPLMMENWVPVHR